MKKEVSAFLSEHLANEPEWIYLIPGIYFEKIYDLTSNAKTN